MNGPGARFTAPRRRCSHGGPATPAVASRGPCAERVAAATHAAGGLARRPALAALLATALVACAGQPQPEPQPQPGGPPGPASWTRHIDPFPVLGADGEPYRHPFLGGLDVPRPQLVDIDGDGDLDLFVQERSNEVMFFENRSGADATRDAQRSENRSGARTGSARRAPASDRDGARSAGDGSPAAGLPRFVWRTDRFADLEVGEWFRFADLDGDGRADVLAEQPYSLIRYYRNHGPAADRESGRAGAARFTLAEDTLRDVAGEPLFSDRQNIPNVTDIDRDGLPDLFVGRLEGTVTRFETVRAVGGDELPAFRRVTDRFQGIEIVAEFVGSAHGANSMVFADGDGDGVEDLFWGDFFEAGLLLIRNTGSGEAPSLRGEPIPFPPGDPLETSGFNAPAVADIDRDGDLDVLVGVLGGAYNPNRTAADNLYLLENRGAAADGTERRMTAAGPDRPDAEDVLGDYVIRTRRFLDGIDAGSESQIALGDVDDDGDLDLLVAPKLDPAALTTSRILFFQNTGAADAPAFRLADTLGLADAYHLAPELADLDDDGDLDLLLGTWNDGVLVAWNEGSPREPRWTLADSPLVTLTRGSHTVPAAADIDADGDLDLFVGEAVGALNLYRNAGTPREPRFELVSDEYGGFDVGRRSSPAFVDLDDDGDPDLVVGGEDGGAACFENGEGELRPLEPCPLPERLLPLSAPAFADTDGDGDADLFSGTLSGGVTFHENRAHP